MGSLVGPDEDVPQNKPAVPEEVQAAVRTLIEWAGDDPAREGLLDTPSRVARAWKEYCLGYGEDPNYAASFDALLVEPTGGSCLNMSKLNLNQCLAVAKPWYEDVFCLGQHVMMDTGKCVIKAAGLPEPYEWKFVPQVKTADAKPAPAASKKAAPKKR